MDKLPISMPNLEKLMNKGITFTNAVTPSPLCAPARACLASGLRYDKCNVENNSFDYPLDQKTFYSVLKENNYNVGGVGKFDLHKLTKWWGVNGWIDELGALGFTHAIDNAGKWDAVHSGKEEPKDPYMKFLYDVGLATVHLDDMKERGQKVEPTQLPDEAYCDNWLSKKGIDMIRDFEKDRPWFLQVNFTGPHDPWDVTKSMREKWENVSFPLPNKWDENSEIDIVSIRQNYAAMLENIDMNIGLFIKEIEKRGELDNTIIIYSSDHGEMLGDFNRFGKSTWHRGSINIPFVIAGPNIQKGVYSDALVELQDITSTILEYANTSMKEAKDSLSLKSLLEGKTNSHREYQVSGLNPPKNNKRKSMKTIFDGKYKLVIEDENIKLFDIMNDPWENNNISTGNEDIVNKLLKVIEV